MSVADQPPPDDVQDAPGDPESVARAICLRLLTQRARSRAELAQALRRRGVPDEAAAVVLQRLTEVGLIDDASLAEQLALSQHHEQGLAAQAVAQRLRQRGLPDAAVETAVRGIDRVSEREVARRLVMRKLPGLRGLPVETQTRRLLGLLGRRGYSSGLSGEVVREALSGRLNEDLSDGLVAE